MQSYFYKYPRTPHLPWSPGATSDDKLLPSVDHFDGKEIVVTEKLDGENTSLYRDHYHARSIDSRHHASQSFVKQLHATIAADIPPMWRLVGENMFAKHSIFYGCLTSYFYIYAIYNENNVCLSWDETEVYAGILNIPVPPVLYRGIFDEDTIRACFTGRSAFCGEQEGYVVRCTGAFCYGDQELCTAKYVRPGHVQTTEHWRTSWIPNQLAEDNT